MNVTCVNLVVRAAVLPQRYSQKDEKIKSETSETDPVVEILERSNWENTGNFENRVVWYNLSNQCFHENCRTYIHFLKAMFSWLLLYLSGTHPEAVLAACGGQRQTFYIYDLPRTSCSARPRVAWHPRRDDRILGSHRVWLFFCQETVTAGYSPAFSIYAKLRFITSWL